MNTITIELCQEDRARLDAIIAALGKLPHCDTCVPKTAEAVIDYTAEKLSGQAPAPARENAPGATEAPAQAKPQTAEEATAGESVAPQAPAEQAPEIDEPKLRHEAQMAVVRLVRAGKKEEIRGVLSAAGTDKVSGIPAEALPKVLEQLRALEG